MHRTCVAAAALAVSLTVISVVSLHADVRADQKTKFQLGGVLGKVVNIFGGKGAREGVESTVAVKGSRKSTITGSSGQIIDLSEEKIYDLDLKKKTYKVTTFDELRRQMDEARRRAEEDAKKEQARESNEQNTSEARDPNQKEFEVDFDVKNTGAMKAINGFNTHQAVITVTVREKGKTLEQSGGLVLTTDLWLAPRIAAMDEVQEFDLKYAQKLYGPMVAGASPQDMAAALAMYPQIKPALEKMAAEASKVEGTAILTTITMDAVKSADQIAQEQQQSQADSPSNARGVGALVGGLARRASRKEEAPQSRATFLTTTNEVLKVTTDVSADDLAIPAGFKESK